MYMDSKLYIAQQSFQKFSNSKVQSYFILTNIEPLVKILFEKQPHLTNLNNVIVLKFFVSYVGPVLEIVKCTLYMGKQRFQKFSNSKVGTILFYPY